MPSPRSMHDPSRLETHFKRDARLSAEACVRIAQAVQPDKRDLRPFDARLHCTTEVPRVNSRAVRLSEY